MVSFTSYTGFLYKKIRGNKTLTEFGIRQNNNKKKTFLAKQIRHLIFFSHKMDGCLTRLSELTLYSKGIFLHQGQFQGVFVSAGFHPEVERTIEFGGLFGRGKPISTIEFALPHRHHQQA